MKINLHWVSRTTIARTCQQDCHYCSLPQLWVATTITILSAQLKVTFMANILVSLCELYNSQQEVRSQTVYSWMRRKLLWW